MDKKSKSGSKTDLSGQVEKKIDSSKNTSGLKNQIKGLFVDVKNEFVQEYNTKMFKNYNKKPSMGVLPDVSNHGTKTPKTDKPLE